MERHQERRHRADACQYDQRTVKRIRHVINGTGTDAEPCQRDMR